MHVFSSRDFLDYPNVRNAAVVHANRQCTPVGLLWRTNNGTTAASGMGPFRVCDWTATFALPAQETCEHKPTSARGLEVGAARGRGR